MVALKMTGLRSAYIYMRIVNNNAVIDWFVPVAQDEYCVLRIVLFTQ